MTATAALPVVRVRVSCADAQEYRQARAPAFAARGVFVPSARMRPVGARVRLKIELLDRTLGHDGEAVVARHARAGARPGYFLKLGGGVDERTDAAPRRAPPAPHAPPPARAARALAAPAAPAVERTPDPIALAEFLFSDLNLGDAAAPAGPLDGDLLELGPKPRRRIREAPRPTPAPTSAAPIPAPGSTATRTATPTSPRDATSGPAGPMPSGEDARPPPLVADGPGTPAPWVTAPWVTALPVASPPAMRPAQAPRTPAAIHLAAAPDDEERGPALAAPAPARREERVRRIRRAAPLVAAVVLGVAVAGGGVLLAGPTRAEARAADLAAELRRADERLRSGRLAGTGSDSALDHLVAARELAPDDPRLARRLALLAELFGVLGERAAARGDLDEARAHFQARLRAAPGNAAFAERLRDLGGPPDATQPPAAPDSRGAPGPGVRGR